MYVYALAIRREHITSSFLFREKYKDYNEKIVNLKGENNMKVTKKDILSIKAGSSKVMQLDSYKDCVNARSYAYQLAFTDPREDVERYSISIDKDKNQITIEAIKK